MAKPQLGSLPATPTTIAFGDAGSAGTAGQNAALADHRHAAPANPVTAHEAAADPHTGYLQESVVSGFGTPGLTLGTANGAGSGTSGIRANATIAAFDTTAPVTQAMGDAAATGSVARAARRDHRHGMPAFGSVTAQTSFGLPSSDGTAATVARSDHAHGTPAAPSAVTPDDQVFTTTGTWAKPAGAYQWARIECCGGGGGGGSGRRGADGTTRYGGGGGGGGGYSVTVVPFADLGATETATVGAGGAGGSGHTSNNTDGNDGADGGDSSLGSHCHAGGGRGGKGGTASAPDPVGGAGGFGTSPGVRGAMPWQWNGQNGGWLNIGGIAISLPGGGAGGGGGGGGRPADNTERPGGDGSGSGLLGPASGGAGADTSGAFSTTSGWITSASDPKPSGGGGGGSGTAGDDLGNAGAIGGAYGGGGGGGGAQNNGGSTDPGGAGASGYVRVICY